MRDVNIAEPCKFLIPLTNLGITERKVWNNYVYSVNITNMKQYSALLLSNPTWVQKK